MRKLAIPLIALPLLFAACESAPHSESQRIPNDQIPPVVMGSFQRTYPGVQISHVDYFPNYHGRGPGYEIKFIDANRNYHRKGFSPDGALLDDPSNVALPGNPQPYAPPGAPSYPPPPRPYPNQPYPPMPAPPPPPRY